MAKQSNSGRHTFFMCVLFLMAAGAITMSAIVLHRMLNEDDDVPTATSAPTGPPGSGAEKGSTPTTPGSTPLPDSRRGAVVDCSPKNLKEKNYVISKEDCEAKQ